MSGKSSGKVIRIFTDGAGQGPGGKGSGFVWLREDTRQKHLERVSGLTNNEAEYRAVISALRNVPAQSSVEIITDSLLVVSQIRGEYRILDSKLVKLANEVKTIAEQKRLTLKLTWVPRSENLAGKLI